MTIQQQFDATVRFHAGDCNLLVATSVAEEGLDFPACNIVVRYSRCDKDRGILNIGSDSARYTGNGVIPLNDA